MKNIEFYSDELKKCVNEQQECYIPECVGNGLTKFCKTHIDEIKFLGKPERFIDWLLEEHKGTIKLSKFEYDLLNLLADDVPFQYSYAAPDMKLKGYFKGIADTTMTIKEILENCEVVEYIYKIEDNANEK